MPHQNMAVEIFGNLNSVPKFEWLRENAKRSRSTHAYFSNKRQKKYIINEMMIKSRTGS
jgi:hypothetical protein